MKNQTNEYCLINTNTLIPVKYIGKLSNKEVSVLNYALALNGSDNRYIKCRH